MWVEFARRPEVSHGLWGIMEGQTQIIEGKTYRGVRLGGCNKGPQDKDDWLGENRVAAIGNPLDSGQCANAKGLQSEGLELLGWGVDHKGLRSSRCDEGGCPSFQNPGLVGMLELGAELLLLRSDLRSVTVQSIYRSEKGYLPWIWYIAHQKNSSTPYDGIVGGGRGTTKGTPTGESVPLPEEVYPYRKISSSTERIFTLY